MRRLLAAIVLLTLLLNACGARPAAPEETQSPATPGDNSPPGDIHVPEGGSYTSAGARDTDDMAWLASYRALPAKYSDDMLRELLLALPPIHIETPQQGTEKFYFRESDSRVGYATNGVLKKADMKALRVAISAAEEGETLRDILAAFGIAYAPQHAYDDDGFPLYNALGGTGTATWSTTLQEFAQGIVCITVLPANLYRQSICHIVFQEEKGGYRFAALYMPSVEDQGTNDLVVEKDGHCYFLCSCGMGWGTGAYSNYAVLLPLQPGAYEYLFYELNGYDCPGEISTNVSSELPEPMPLPDGGIHFTIQGTFRLENYATVEYADFETVFSGTTTYHVFDDGDGRGLYTYAKDMGVNFYLSQSQEFREALRQRIAILLRAEDESACFLAERLLWEQDIKQEEVPYLTRAEAKKRQEALQQRAYALQENGGKYYIGSTAPLPAAGGMLSEAELQALEQALQAPDADVKAAMLAAGLRLPEGLVLQDSMRAQDGMPAAENEEGPPEENLREVRKYTQGDALALEVRIPTPQDSYFIDAVTMLFFREADTYACIAVFSRVAYAYEEEDQVSIVRLQEDYYFRYLKGRESADISEFVEEGVWIPFVQGNAVSRFRFSGGCALAGLPGLPIDYFWWINPAVTVQEDAAALAVEIAYGYYPLDIHFRVPLILQHDAGGFYSLDAGSMYFFTDILQVPYAREMFFGLLDIRAQSANRYYRAAASELKEMLKGQ